MPDIEGGLTINQIVVTVPNADANMNSQIDDYGAEGYVLTSLTPYEGNVIMLFTKTSITPA